MAPAFSASLPLSVSQSPYVKWESSFKRWYLGVPWWCSKLRIQHWHWCGPGHCCGLASISGLGISTCHGCSQKIIIKINKIKTSKRINWGLKQLVWDVADTLGTGGKLKKNEHKSWVCMCGVNRRFRVLIHENPTFTMKTQAWSPGEGQSDHLGGNFINTVKGWHYRVPKKVLVLKHRNYLH